MGYTHYWYRPPNIANFKEFAMDCKKIIDSCNVPTAWECDKPKKSPATSSEVVRFNGIGDDGHETFYVEKTFKPEEWQKPKEGGLYFEFCKTARKPYDVVVTACLIALHHHCPDVKISSDGGNDEWGPGRDLCQRILGYGEGFEIAE